MDPSVPYVCGLEPKVGSTVGGSFNNLLEESPEYRRILRSYSWFGLAC